MAKTKRTLSVPAAMNGFAKAVRRPWDQLADAFARSLDPWHDERVAYQREADEELGRGHRAKQRARSKAGVETKRDARARHDEALLAAVRALRTKHRDWSRPSIARELLRRRQVSAPNVKALAARILRLEHR